MVRPQQSALWQYRCDQGHSWTVAETIDGAEPDAGTCPEGHLSVTARREPWADRVSFALVPVARVADAVRETVVDEGLYEVSIQTPDGTKTLRSRSLMTLGEASSRLAELSRIPTSEALERADRMGFEPVA